MGPLHCEQHTAETQCMRPKNIRYVSGNTGKIIRVGRSVVFLVNRHLLSTVIKDYTVPCNNFFPVHMITFRYLDQ